MRSFYTIFLDSLWIALRSIFTHRLRSFLTLIGIIIGVASVVIVGASIDGLNAYVQETVLRVFGVNHFIVSRFVFEKRMTDEEIEKMIRRNKPLNEEDLKRLADNCPTCAEVGARVTAVVSVQLNGTGLNNTVVQGVTANMFEIEDKTLAEGRFLLPHEIEDAGLVCVVGKEIMEVLFQGSDPVGQTLKVSGRTLLIVGVEEQRGSLFGQSLDRNIYIPLTTFDRMYSWRKSLELHAKAVSREQLDAAIEDARVAIRNHHKLRGNEDDDFGMTDVTQLNNQVDEFTHVITLVVTPVTLISLLVGGIVVMNIMLVTVTERAFEIGLRKAVGAKKKHILIQFLVESSLLTGCGGGVGLLVAAALTALINISTSVPMTITAYYILLSLLVSSGVGVIAGIYPAYKAANLDPITALGKV